MTISISTGKIQRQGQKRKASRGRLQNKTSQTSLPFFLPSQRSHTFLNGAAEWEYRTPQKLSLCFLYPEHCVLKIKGMQMVFTVISIHCRVQSSPSRRLIYGVSVHSLQYTRFSATLKLTSSMKTL